MRILLLQAELFHAYRGSGWFYYQSAGIGLLQWPDLLWCTCRWLRYGISAHDVFASVDGPTLYSVFSIDTLSVICIASFLCRESSNMLRPIQISDEHGLVLWEYGIEVLCSVLCGNGLLILVSYVSTIYRGVVSYLVTQTICMGQIVERSLNLVQKNGGTVWLSIT